MVHGRSIWTVLASSALLCAGTGTTLAQPPAYEIIDLGTLGGASSVALGINDVGQVVGSADTSAGLRHAYIWENRRMRDLGALPGHPQSEAWDVNNLGHAVGLSALSTNSPSAFVWKDGVMIDLGHLTGALTGDTSAYGINDAGQVVGRSRVSLVGVHAFLWEDGVMTDLSETYGIGPGAAWDINGAGRVLKGSKLLNVDGTVITLPTLGGDLTQGFSLNELGQVVGWSERVPAQRIFHAFLWDNGEMIDLGALGGFNSSRAWAINDAGQVVGNPRFLYDPQEGMLDLADLIPCESGWSSLSPRDINNADQIVGWGGFKGLARAFLMTPVDAVPGKCCFDAEFDPQCVDGVTDQECCGLPGPRFFFPGRACTGTTRQCPTDCNFNGIRDDEDIVTGTSEDCDANALPDECEILPDSDEDGVDDCRDECPGIDDSTFAPDCQDAIPTLSSWGLIVLVMSLLVAAKIYFGWPTMSER